MGKCWSPVALLFPILLALAAANAAQEKGSIRGIVVDETGAPLAGAKVNARPLGAHPSSTFIRYVETDPDGHFLIDRLDWGTYGVFAMKEQDDYPDLSASLYSNNVFPTVTLAPSAPVANLRIQLGPKAGVITGSVTSSTNGEPLNSSFKLIRAASPDEWLATSVPSNYRILLPSSTDVLVQVFAPCFNSWSLSGPIRLLPGEEIHIDIALQPSHNPNLHPSKFLVPDGYVGWLLLEYDVKGEPAGSTEDGYKIFKFPAKGALNTSSPGPERGADDEYFYYSADGSLREVPTDYRAGKGMIWGKHQGSRNGVMCEFGFFVGTEKEYKKYEMLMTHPGPRPAA